MAKRRRTAKPSNTIERLRRQLKEANDTLNAIRDGHVDALVVDSPLGEQLFTLRTADQPYRLMVEQMREGALTLSADGTVLYCNDRFAELMGVRAERITARPFTEFVAADDRARIETMLTSAMYRDDVQLLSADGSANPAQLSSISLVIDGMRRDLYVKTDKARRSMSFGFSERRRGERRRPAK